MQNMMTRRRFLKKTAAAVALPTLIPSAVLGRDGQVAPSNRIVMGAIGLGFAWEHWLNYKQLQLSAVCDVREDRRNAAQQRVDAHYGSKGCKVYNDFRETLARTDIDAVYIAAPDHWHALITIAAAQAGKDIYCQKPVTHTVTEGQAVRDAVKRYGVVFQHGTQQRSEWSFRRGAELVLNGRIGKLHTIKLGVPSGRSIGPQPVEPVPKGFDYDMWLGPAPWAPYTTARCTGMHTWYFISDYCVGYIAGWGVHHLDSAQQGNGSDLIGPLEVDGRGVFPEDGLYDTPVTWRVDYKYANGVTIIDTDVTQNEMGVLYEGTDGKVFCWRNERLETEPKSLRDSVIGPNEIRVYESDDHFQNFLDCTGTRKPTAAPVEVAHHSTTLCNIGAISMVLGRKLQWDGENERFLNDDEANRMLSVPMREPWRL